MESSENLVTNNQTSSKDVFFTKERLEKIDRLNMWESGTPILISKIPDFLLKERSVKYE